jgi:hypothetical protein
MRRSWAVTWASCAMPCCCRRWASRFAPQGWHTMCQTYTSRSCATVAAKVVDCMWGLVTGVVVRSKIFLHIFFIFFCCLFYVCEGRLLLLEGVCCAIR